MSQTSPLALGIDVGTSGVRAALLDGDGRTVGFSAARMADAGEDLRDPQVWRRTLATALEGLEPAGRARVGALAVDGTSGTVLALDAEGAPLGSGLLYNDAVEDPTIPEAIGRLAPRDSAAHGAASALARAMELAKRPGVRGIVHQADWIAGLLSGRADISDESNALKTGYDPVARAWPEWVGHLIDRALLPDVVPAGAATGSVSADASARFGLPAGTRTVAGVSDGCASFLATGASQPGDGVTALGTTLTVKLLSDRPVFAPEYGIYSHRVGDLWLAGGASNTGGGALAVHFSPAEIAELSERIDPSRDSGLDYYPLPKPGERFPTADPTLAPRTEPRPDDDARFLQGLLEGVARIEAAGYRRLAELGAPPLKRLRSVGTGAGNAAWSALRLRILGVEAAPALSEEAAAGVARLALPHLVVAAPARA
jgi:sugar (pentulose or hexulose) kinase